MDNGTLFQPIDVRGITLRNRFVALPVGLSGFTDSTDTPTERMVAHYRRRALGGAALVTVGIAYTEPYQISKRALLGFYSDKQIPMFSVLADSIQQVGARAAIQFTHRWHADFPYEMDDLSVAEIESMIDHYVRGAVRARAAGFDMVEFEVGHGWPLARFASPLTNHRHDRYGDYSLVPSEVVRRARAAVGDEMALSVRLTIVDDLDHGEGITLEQSVNELCPAFEAAGVDMLSLTFGLGPIARKVRDYRSSEILYIEPGDKFHYFKEVKDRVRVPVVGRSRINDPSLAARAVDEGWMDLVGLARQLLADPDFPAKLQEGREQDVTHCIYCDYCRAVTVQRIPTLRCTVNGELGRELDANLAWPAVRRPKRVLVVGGGPAGMQAALALAQRGCEVTLLEKNERLGGMVRSIARLPHLRMVDLEYAVDDLARQLAGTNVDIRLNTPLSADLIAELRPEVVVRATGSAPNGATLSSNGARVSVHSFLDYLHGVPLGKRVVVDGRGEGAEFAVSLARGGYAVTLVESSMRLLPTAYDYPGRRVEALEDYLPQSGVRSLWGCRVGGIEGGEVLVERQNGRVERVESDSLLVAGRVPVREGMGALADVKTVYEIGDCRRPRGLAEALEEARAVAVTIAG